MPEVDVQVVKTKKGKNVATWRLQEEAFDQDDFLAEEESAHIRQRNLIEKREKRVTKALQSGLLKPDNGVTRLDTIHQHRRIEE